MVLFKMKIRTLFVLLLWCSVCARAGEITGKVLNSQGAAIAGATVTAGRSQETGPPSKTITKADGSFVVPDLAPGIYMVTVTITGGQALRREISVPDKDSAVRANFQAAQASGEG